MMQSGEGELPHYIGEESLAVWLDGYQSAIDGGKIHSLVGDIVFNVLSGTKEKNSFERLVAVCEQTTSFSSLTDTIEVVCNVPNVDYNYIYFANRGTRSNDFHVCVMRNSIDLDMDYRNTSYIDKVFTPLNCISFNDKSCLHNGNIEPLKNGGTLLSSSGGKASIGGAIKTAGTNPSGTAKTPITLYSLRIYKDRILTTNEMQHNFQIDNERFKLGL